ncbi:CPBP family intramembrane glutamic endopeptidase [Neptunitalea lumnitzerae]|uniref:CPBP family intramembrane metalloprotease n=1 Tax=Neptunitalea lumnitzerae TaxID=2965509 RepID=A0ABQ5MMK3_9FLAO|nr:type II CAAX endopeptidase family protein [Neptunitalea sp. Y10]GLB50638.1 CPBP family intramembrane metalloprotease [Neptunitalea sp. Y10]
MDNNLRKFWRKYFSLHWKFGLFLVVLLCVPRFFLVLQANEQGNYGVIGMVMFLSAIVPFIFLNRNGTKNIGLRTPKSIFTLLLALLAGIVFSVVLYFIGDLLYGGSYENWYEYIGKSYAIPENITADAKRTMFIIMAITGMIFSPIGEELFFRGIVHFSFAKSVGDRKASFIDSAAFAITHISHFGLVFIAGGWDFYFVPTLLWVSSMFLVSLLFFKMKQLTGSIWGAVLCHSGFNLGMIYSIFYLL